MKLKLTLRLQNTKMADLNQFLNQGMSADDVAHTSGVGAGGAGGLSMEQRRKLLNQPRVVGAYRYSLLGRQGSGIKARTADQQRGRVYDPGSDSFSDSAKTSNRQQGGIKDQSQVDSKSVERRQRFIEPSSRPAPKGYDKYA